MDSGMYSIVLLVLMFALLYFFMIRPENKRKKQAQAMRDSLTVGDEITTIGGIIGTICAVKEEHHRYRDRCRPCADRIHQVGRVHQGGQTSETTK